MTVKLHHCPFTWLKVPGHDCYQVRKALDDEGIEYEIVKHPALPRSRRTALVELTGQQYLPAIEFDDGAPYKEDSKQMIERIRAGRLFESAAAPPGAAATE